MIVRQNFIRSVRSSKCSKFRSDFNYIANNENRKVHLIWCDLFFNVFKAFEISTTTLVLVLCLQFVIQVIVSQMSRSVALLWYGEYIEIHYQTWITSILLFMINYIVNTLKCTLIWKENERLCFLTETIDSSYVCARNISGWLKLASSLFVS